MSQPLTCEQAASCGKRDFADSMNHKDCEMGVILGYPDGPHLTACPLGRQALPQVWYEGEVSVEKGPSDATGHGLGWLLLCRQRKGCEPSEAGKDTRVQSVKDLESQS